MRVVFIFLVFISCAGCHRSAPTILPVNKMTNVMWDMIQVDEFATGFLAKDSSKNIKLERMKLYQQVFTLHHVSDKDYFASFKYYTAQPDLFKTMIDSLSGRATREQSAIHVPTQVPVSK
ncbi:MAG: DUF4296 domain-containing protein [Williamsia sp.]|nr:DUF4296 domain-containing protein [Williamsia sp.]